MTESFQTVLFAVLAVITPLFALIGLVVSLSSETFRRGLLPALVCAGIGFFAVFLVFGGGSSDFQQLAIVIGVLFAFLSACAGLLAENPSLSDETAQKLKAKFEAMISGLGVVPRNNDWPDVAQRIIWYSSQNGLSALGRRDKK